MRIRTYGAIIGAALAAVAITAGTARADLRLMQTMTTSATLPGADNTTPTKTVLYYKGDKSRVDVETGKPTVTGVGRKSISRRQVKTTLFDATTGKMVVLDAAAKTYYETSPGDLVSQVDFAAAAGIQMDAKADVSDTGEEKQICGKTAHRYHFELTITMSSPTNAEMAAMMPTINMSGDEWTIAIPDSITSVSKLQSSSFLSQMSAGLGKSLQPLVDKMATIKGLCVEMDQTMKMIPSPTAPAEVSRQLEGQSFSITTTTTSVSEDGLSDSLFAIPADYTKVDPPPPPKMPELPSVPSE